MKRLILIFISLFLLDSKLLKSQDFQTFSDDFTNWSNNAGWNGTDSPGRFINGDEVEINGNVIYDDSNYGGGPLVIDGTDATVFGNDLRGYLIISSGSTLLIRGDLELPAGGRVVVEDGGTLIIDGNFNSTGGGFFFSGGDTSNEGRVAVTGNYTQGGSGSYSGGGEVNVAGTSTESEPDGTGNPQGGQTIPADLQAIIDDPTTLPIELKKARRNLNS
ncbi:hypothetical protein QYS48_25735 [Marivirga arenosa]|uniref:Uncharacterized protein n=1 Tax=Marivirga arenosa TaxID=3059076 RepID=A0AA49JDI0_9BACT|nr:hypothetical protein [Marivirga sp. ABR2-2]WKK85310.1 hypothetical protein QYS48_25735 [Marivirga sp. ABR2-2]